MNDLTKAVAEQMGHEVDTEDFTDEMANVNIGGAMGGFSGFTYYTDTVQFFDDNQSLVMAQLRDDAEQLGASTVAEFVASFRCLDDDYEPFGVELALSGDHDDENYVMQVKNACAWYALETVAFQVQPTQFIGETTDDG